MADAAAAAAGQELLRRSFAHSLAIAQVRFRSELSNMRDGCATIQLWNPTDYTTTTSISCACIVRVVRMYILCSLLVAASQAILHVQQQRA